MFQTFMARRRAERAQTAEKVSANGPSVQELAAGARPTTEQMGSRVDLPGEIREKMESSFGADFSNVKLYESQTVAEAGAEAVTQGNNIAFAPGKLDLASTAGQALLGHELSHVVSQARGESAGQGFLNDPGLEAQADRQGMMAAQGESVYQGPVSPVGASSTMSAAGPMQAKKKDDKPLSISQPEIDEKQTGKLRKESENIRNRFRWGTEKSLGMWDMDKPREAYAATNAVEHGISNREGIDEALYGQEAPDEKALKQSYNNMYVNGHHNPRGQQGDPNRLGLVSYWNFKQGVKNSRQARGLSSGDDLETVYFEDLDDFMRTAEFDEE